MRRFVLSLAALGCLGGWASLAPAKDPAYQDRHFRHYGLHDYFLGQDFSRRETFFGPPGYDAALPAVNRGQLPPASYIPLRRPESDPSYVPLPRPEYDPSLADRGYSYYREYRELQWAKQLINTRPDAAKRRLLEIVTRYPGTRAASEAAELLRTLP